MLRKHSARLLLVIATMAGGFLLPSARAKDIKINIPKHSKLTPVQRLNREGVEQVRKHNYQKAERLFYKAYLYDPDDPFTLNNLGYISEMQGQLDRAERFYTLASEQPSDAVISRASAKRVEGRPMSEALALKDEPLKVNHANVEAVRLLSQGRAPEADLLLRKALQEDPHNTFTLNNMGVAKEMEGEAEEALRYFDEASGGSSDNKAIVTIDRNWRGKPVSDMAQQNAKSLRTHLEKVNDLNEQIAELNLRGVSAVNRNELRVADANFRKAYALDPNNAFTLNNLGFVSEMVGDRETAEFFYEHAREAAGSRAVVGVASRRDQEGKRLATVASDSDSKVETKVTQERNALRQQNEPVVLRRRDNSIVNETQPNEQPNPSNNPQPPQR